MTEKREWGEWNRLSTYLYLFEILHYIYISLSLCHCLSTSHLLTPAFIESIVSFLFFLKNYTKYFKVQSNPFSQSVGPIPISPSLLLTHPFQLTNHIHHLMENPCTYLHSGIFFFSFHHCFVFNLTYTHTLSLTVSLPPIPPKQLHTHCYYASYRIRFLKC